MSLYFLLYCEEDFSTVCESLAIGKETVERKDDDDNSVVYGTICTKHCHVPLLLWFFFFCILVKQNNDNHWSVRNLSLVDSILDALVVKYCGWGSAVSSCSCQQIYNPFEYCFQGICNVQLSKGILLRASQLHHSQLSTRVSLPTQTLTQDQKLLNLTMEGR